MLWETLLLAIRAIRRNVLRSTLTILGIVIGVAAVITMVTLGKGATIQVASEIGNLGSNMLQVRPGQGFRGPGGARSEASMFKIEDAEAIKDQVTGLEAVAPLASKGAQAIYGNENWSTVVYGTTDEYLQVRDWLLEGGRSFTPSELHSGKAVCIIGATVKKELFGGANPLGASIRLGKLSCEVIGVLESKGASAFGSDQDDFVLIPLRTFQRRIAGNTDVSAVMLSALSGVPTEKVQKDVEQLLRERRRISVGEDDDFHVRDMKEIVSTLTGTTRVLTALLGAVAAVSLLVGGIGIMNIMLVSVTERTREIGTRLAIGALEREVLLQFLVEAVVLSLFGGLFGVILGLSAAAFGSKLLHVPFIINPGIMALAFLFSGAVGVIFGYFPARQAARLDPIEALRHE
ncbi:MAG TPA: ABC transporter permease [Deltaproteobacteria bacterium]|jgi:putative ABC transport system permease protein|nr:ABC transporter permease [Deltaproteobacteria bacterium]OQC26628.1 MAG: Macrolide export ATP-binding/permease protein MacB [Deltaproteobacteria bacterium ADurb.Bin072]HOP44319.1 ABC transporter permease [Flavobacteriales bacterium]NMD39372.1 FtsX-like permease family protein [Deltaproteobacteria bacterium]HNQ86450.1 ABC transporter permease [Deltaproteobacteria bacterium]